MKRYFRSRALRVTAIAGVLSRGGRGMFSPNSRQMEVKMRHVFRHVVGVLASAIVVALFASGAVAATRLESVAASSASLASASAPAFGVHAQWGADISYYNESRFSQSGDTGSTYYLPQPRFDLPSISQSSGGGFVELSGTAALAALSSSAHMTATSDGYHGHPNSFTQWSDTVTVTSDTLPRGTPAQFRLTLDVQDTATLTGRSPGFDGAWINANAHVGQNGLVFDDATGGTSSPTTQTLVVSTLVGDMVPVDGSLSVQANATSTEPSNRVVEARAEASAIVHIDPITPGVSYATDSGTSYTTPSVDATPPTTSADATSGGSAYADGSWTKGDVNLMLSAVDSAGGSGVKEIDYSATGAQPIAATSAAGNSVQIPITAEGSTTISYSAVDNAGNREGEQTFTVKIDKTAPSLACDAPDGLWHGGNVSLACGATDDGSGLANPGDATFGLSTSVPTDAEDANAATDARQVCDTAGNCVTAGPIAGNKIDRKAPGLSCDSPDGAWHGSNVSLGCSAVDGGSGLAAVSDGSFSLSTSVPSGIEDANAATGSRSVCDAVGNCATAGPIAGNKVDRKAPSISIGTPANAVYLLNKAVAASYSCADGGSGATSCAGSVANGANIDTSSVGTKSFTVDATDAVGNRASASVSYTVSYDVFLLYDPAKATSTIQLQIRDGNGVNLSAASLVVTAKNIDGTIPQSGNFTYVKSMAAYKYSLPKGLARGPHKLYFIAGSDPTLHFASFTSR
jgi:hypothetical protein